jgi:hypothetical protein
MTATAEEPKVRESLCHDAYLAYQVDRDQRLSLAIPMARPNPPMQSTPLCGLKIVAILESTFVLSAVPIYRAARLMGIPLGRTRLSLSIYPLRTPYQAVPAIFSWM